MKEISKQNSKNETLGECQREGRDGRVKKVFLKKRNLEGGFEPPIIGSRSN
jgi:hypothetical protein